MRFWERFTRRHKPSSIEGQLVIGNAYRAVFLGNPTREEREMVLTNLASRCGWNQITPPSNASDREIWFNEGKRAAFAEVFAHLSLSPADVAAIENAVRHETSAYMSMDANTGIN